MVFDLNVQLYEKTQNSLFTRNDKNAKDFKTFGSIVDTKNLSQCPCQVKKISSLLSEINHQ